MTVGQFAARARRALRRSPRYLAARGVDAIRRRAQRPWSAVVPKLITIRTVLRESGAADVDALWTTLAARPFFLSSGDRDTWVNVFNREFPETRAVIVGEAERSLRHEFDLLGSGPVGLGDPIPWLTDFKTGKTWPLQYCRQIEYNELDRPTDVKVPWELSRCQHFVRLGQAYWFTSDERYAREFVDEVRAWQATNPYAWSVNWACAMDVALRAVSWIWGFYFLAEAEACRSREFRAQFLQSLYLHGQFVATNLERSDVNGNHYLWDGVGLVFLGCLFGATSRGRKWRAIGRDLVVSEIFNQVTPDGVDFEQSTAYHRLVLEAFMTSFLLLEKHGESIPADAWAQLQRMCEYVEAYTKPNGLAPLVGDADDGRVQILGTQAIGDHRYLLSTGAVRFGRADFKARAGCFFDESFWTLGPAGLDSFRALPHEAPSDRSRAFADGGFYVLRSRDAHVFIDCGEVGMRGRGGHGHNDILSFELFLNGMNVVTDCGAYLYTASREWRNAFRSTAFHNSVQVDDEEVNRFVSPDSLWHLQYDAHPADAVLTRRPRVDRFSGSHDGYERLTYPVTHTREWVLDREHPRVLVRDSLTGTGWRQLTWRFHLDPAIVPERDGANVRLSNGARTVWLVPAQPAPEMTLEITDGWVSPSYGVRVPTNVLVWRVRARVPLTVSFLFAESADTQLWSDA
ncbi:MAG TPA: alginate lyase family protein [Vicinamibacterales bacterium]|nr:alginate lyase family protein [Vicinamibacterales bacterium]